jgi:hypothetical protein
MWEHGLVRFAHRTPPADPTGTEEGRGEQSEQARAHPLRRCMWASYRFSCMNVVFMRCHTHHCPDWSPSGWSIGCPCGQAK